MPIPGPNTPGYPPYSPPRPPQVPAGLSPVQLAQLMQPAQQPMTAGSGPGGYVGQGTYIPGYNPQVGMGAPSAPPPAASGGGGGAPFNGHYQEGPYGNWADEWGTWHDAWGNTIPHAGYVPGGGGAGTPPELRYMVGQTPEGQPLNPVATAPVAPAATPALPGPQAPPVFYAPSTSSPYLTLPQNWLSFVDPNVRLQLDEQLQRIGFRPTGTIGQFGEGVYLRPPSLSDEQLAFISDPNIRQWIRFYLGSLGYGSSYTLPSLPTGTPTAPQTPARQEGTAGPRMGTDANGNPVWAY